MKIALDELTIDEKISTDMVAFDFVRHNHIVTRDAKHLYLFDNTCWRQRSKEYIEHLVFKITPSELRDRLSYIVNNVITRTHVEPKMLHSAHCFASDGSGDLLINCANGVLRYQIASEQCTLQKHDVTLMFTRCLAANYDPGAECPLTEKTLLDVLPDKRDHKTIWCFGAYVLIPDCRLEQCVSMFGEGAAGKGTIAKALTSALGEELVTHIDMAALLSENGYFLGKAV